MKKILYSLILIVLITVLTLVGMSLAMEISKTDDKSIEMNKKTQNTINFLHNEQSINNNTKDKTQPVLRVREVNGKYINVENSQEVYYKQEVQKINSNRAIINDEEAIISS